MMSFLRGVGYVIQALVALAASTVWCLFSLLAKDDDVYTIGFVGLLFSAVIAVVGGFLWDHGLPTTGVTMIIVACFGALVSLMVLGLEYLKPIRR